MSSFWAVTARCDESRLFSLITFNKKKHWLKSDLNIVPATKISQIFFIVIKNQATLKKYLMGIDHVQTALVLKKRRRLILNEEAGQKVIVYNIAIQKFNHLSPKNMLRPIQLKAMLNLIERIEISPFKNNETDGFIFKRTIEITEWTNFCRDFKVQNFNLAIYRQLKSFQEKGGTFVKVPYQNSGERRFDHPYGIKLSDELLPICHAGHVRSQITHLILKILKQKLGSLHGEEKVRNPHGMTCGWDGDIFEPADEYSNKESFEEAFGKIRPFRFGRGVSRDEATDYFNKNYWHIPLDLKHRKIYIAFAENGIKAVKRLLEANPEASFENVYVMIIPDGDWISNHQPETLMKEFLMTVSCEIAQGFRGDALKAYIEEKLIEILPQYAIFGRNISFDNTPYFRKQIAEFCEFIAGLSEEEKHIEIYKFLQPFVWRYAFSYYSDFFYGIKEK